MSTKIIVYICYGQKAIQSALESAESLRKFHKHNIIMVSDIPITGYQTILFDDCNSKGRWAKVNLDIIVPYQNVLYLDADTRINEDLSIYFDTLLDGFDLCITPSKNQGKDLFWHLGQDDKQAIYQDLQFQEVLQLQAGVFSFRKSQAISKLFQSWRQEWLRFKRQDQGALIRALYNNPVKLYLLSNVFNGGSVVNHLFGKLR